ncbi:MAG TPA: hypothetical protein VIH72_09230 [Candidatus Acidoferrales bacterium]
MRKKVGERLGWAALVVAFLATGVVYLWADKRWIGWAALALCALTVIGWLVWEISNREKAQEGRSASMNEVTDSVKQTQNLQDVGNPRINIYTAPNPPSVEARASWPQPNLECKPILQDWLFGTDLGISRYDQYGLAKKVFCGIAKLCNEPRVVDIAEAHRIKALIVFVNQQGGELGRSEPGMWIDNGANLQNIPPGESKELLLFTRDDEQTRVFQITNPNAPYNRYTTRTLHPLVMTPIHEPDSIARIELRVLQEDGKLLATFVIPCCMINGHQLIFGNPERIQAAGS